MQPTTEYLNDARDQFRKYRTMAERAMIQVSDEAFFQIPFEDGNSIAILSKHMAGNMLSRWTDFLTSDGEKPDRNRDNEFEMDENWTRQDVMSYWEKGWKSVYSAVDTLSDDDLERVVTIRGERHSVVRAISRQLTHYAYHVGQIVLIARHHAGKDWKTLSISRGKSEQFNNEHWGTIKASRPENG